MNVPLIDLSAQNKVIGDQLIEASKRVILSAQYIMGNEVNAFENDFGAYLGVDHSISVANGTDALIIALKALGIGEGDEVITTPFTFFATAESISFVGAKPVFVDVEKDSFNMDPQKIEAAITPKTKAILPVHIFGLACDMDAIMAIAKAHDLFVIEDACQAVGGMYKGKKVGTIGDVACFSFFPTKNLGAAGDGGMIVTNNMKIATICRALRTHGSGENGRKAYNFLHRIEEEVEADTSSDNTVYNPLKYYNYLVGHNSRLDEIQAAFLSVKLKYLDQWNARRREIAELYKKGINGTSLITPVENHFATHVYHMFIVQSEDKDKLINYLKSKGIATGAYYPVPLHLQKAYDFLGCSMGDFPNAEYLSKRTLAIPMYPELSEPQIEYIIAVITDYFNDSRG